MENPLPNQQDPDQDQQRNNGNVGGDSTNMTIEFLRARLLAERSVSRTARQRADELAKRVVELEEQLKIVSVQRKKAEKATADVLAILENHGLSDFSEEFDSGSDEEVNNFESKMGQTNFREDESLVGSQIETSSLTGRSLSWKSGKDSPSSGGKKTGDFSLKKRNPFSSSSLVSPRRSAGGKSCRRIRQKETRSAVEEHTDGSIQAPQKTGDATEIPKSSSGNQNLNILVDDSGDLLGNHMHNRDNKEMERALEHQAQLIGQYEEEEKAQREWEEKFRENDNSPVSCERGTTQSDITEERDETRADSSPCTVQSNGSIDFEAKPNVESVLNSEQSSSTSKISGQQPSPPLVSLSKGENTSGNNYGRHDKMPSQGSESLGSVLEALQQAKLSLNHKIKVSPQLNGGSLKNAIELNPKDRPEIPVGSAGIFKVPSDFYPANIMQNNTFLASNPRLTLANYYHDEQTALNSTNQLVSGRSSETFWPGVPSHPNNSTYSYLNINGGVRDRMDTNIPFPSPYLYNSRNIETKNVRSSYASPTSPLHTDPMLLMPYGGERPLLNRDINRSPLHTPYGEERPFSSLDRNQVRTYPLYTDPMVRVPSGEEHVFPSTGTGIGPSDLSFYNNLRPNMYR